MFDFLGGNGDGNHGCEQRKTPEDDLFVTETLGDETV
jgi:hypothetical protein